MITQEPGIFVFKDHTLLAQYPADAFVQSADDGSVTIVQYVYNDDGTVTTSILGSYKPGEYHAIGNILCGYIKPNALCARCNRDPKSIPQPVQVTTLAQQRKQRSDKYRDAVIVNASEKHLKPQDPRLVGS